MKINGQLVFDASSASEIQNLRVQKFAGAGVTAYTSADAGRMIFVTDSGGSYIANTLYYGSQGVSNWVAIATGGNAAALQTEVDNIEVSLGSIVTTNGVFVQGQVTGAALTGTETSVQAILQAISNYMTGKDSLSELLDVNVAVSLLDGQYLKYNSGTSKWVNDTLQLNDVTDVTVTIAQLNLLTGLTASAAELNILDTVTGVSAADITSIGGYAAQGVDATEFGYVNGVTSPIQTQLNAKQALDATLTALADLDSSAGIVVQTGADTFVKRTLVAPAAGFTISNPAGTAGNPTFVLANDLAALEGLTTTGYVVRTADGAAAIRSIAGTAGNIVVTNGDGVASNTDINLVTVTDSGTGTFLKFTRDTFGRVSGTTAVVVGDITSLVDTVYVNVGGDTMTGDLNMGTNFVTMNNVPTTGTQGANKAYVDSLLTGLSWKPAVRAATTADITLSAPQTVDGVVLVAGDRVLVKNQTLPAENGIYVVAAGAWTRATDMDSAAEFDGSAVFVQEGTANEGQGFTETATVTTVGTSAVVFSQFSGGQAFIWGTGLGNSGNTIFVNLGAGIAELPSDEIGLDIVAGKAVQLDSALTGGKLTFVLDGAGLEQSAAGLKISAAGVTNAMLVNSIINLNGDTGSDAVSLGESILFAGSAVNGLDSVVTGNTVTFTPKRASSSQLGVASFNAGDFTVTAGNVVIAAAGVDNAQLANSTISYTGTTGGAQTVALGANVSILGGSAPITTASAAGSVTISVADATTGAKGLASFNSDFFSVTAGAVDLLASIDDLTNVSGADVASTGDLLTKSAGDWVPVTRTALAGTIVLGDLQDVGAAAATTAGQALISNGSTWNATKIYHLETISVAATTWTVTHSLGQQYCNVTVIDSTDNMVIPQSVVYTSTTVVTVTFNTAITGKVVVMGIA